MNWLPLLLFALAGLLAGGVGAFWKESRVAAIVLLVLVVGCVAGGVLWLI